MSEEPKEQGGEGKRVLTLVLVFIVALIFFAVLAFLGPK